MSKGRQPQRKILLKAIREFCLWCQNGDSSSVKWCNVRDCIFFDYREVSQERAEIIQLHINDNCYTCNEGLPLKCRQDEKATNPCPLFRYRPKGKYRRFGAYKN